MQPIPQPDRNHQQPTEHEPHLGHELDFDHLDPIPQPDWPAQRFNTREEPTMTTTGRSTIDWTRLHAELSRPFADSDIRYRAGATNRDKTKAQALPFVDPRTYEDRLNEIVPGDWEVTFEPWGEQRIICRLTIHGVTRSSTGEANDSPDGIAGTRAEAQAFRRACAKFGLGRHLYSLIPQWVEYDATRKTVRPPTPHSLQSANDHHSTGITAGIGRKRADAMAHALDSVGLTSDNHLGFAAVTVNRYVRDLAHLTNDEARAVWLAARETGPKTITERQPHLHASR